MQSAHSYRTTPQVPIHSGFGPHTTAREALRGQDLLGKTALVTGGYSGIGLETTRALAEAGATVIVPARTPAKARAALGGMPRVELEEMDLIDPASVDACAQRFLHSGRALHMLINNAGIMAAPLVRDARGYESQFATNHLGHFQLTLRLWPALQRAGRAGGARVVSLSSSSMRFGAVDFDDPHYQRRPYDRWNAYGQSKTANALFAVALDKCGHRDGIRAFAVHPGGINTDLARYMSEDEKRAYTGPLKTPEQGAATSVWCATSPQLDGKGGVYCVDCDIAEVIDGEALEGLYQVFNGVIPWAIDPDSAERLWQLSEEMTGVQFSN
jgi:NAD(P)-dependent dehydrogenase (short-subunit alcohol dehydrogenase family)